jgi:polar amino acid transport system permease protein
VTASGAVTALRILLRKRRRKTVLKFFADMWLVFTRYNRFFAEGVRNTLVIAAVTVLFGTIFGTLMAMMLMTRFNPLKLIALAYIEFIRGTPLMVQLMFIFYGLPMLGITFPDVSWIPNFSRFAAGLVAMSMNSCAYVAELVRSGIQAVDVGQMEAARSIGFSHTQAMTNVVLPQAVRNILPALGNEFVTVIKESSIVSVIGIADLMFRTNDVIAVTYRTLACLAVAALIYFVMTFVSSRLIALMERKMSHEK